MWRKPTEDDLIATLSEAEISAFRKSASFSGADPIEALLRRTAQFVRGYCRSGAVKMDPDETTIPEGLISPAMDYAAFDVLKRMPIKVGEDRKKARDDAIEMFEAVAAGKYKPDGFDQADDGGTATVHPAFGDPPIRRRLD